LTEVYRPAFWPPRDRRQSLCQLSAPRGYTRIQTAVHTEAPEEGVQLHRNRSFHRIPDLDPLRIRSTSKHFRPASICCEMLHFVAFCCSHTCAPARAGPIDRQNRIASAPISAEACESTTGRLPLHRVVSTPVEILAVLCRLASLQAGGVRS